METQVRAKRIGGSIGLIIPKEIVRRERIVDNSLINIKVEKINNLNFMWGGGKNVKISTDEIMKEMDEGDFE